MKYLFNDDYSEGAHRDILMAVADANVGQEPGYGADDVSALAAARIAAEFGRSVDVHLVSGGTQANIVCLASMLRHHEGVIAPESGHIQVHETGAIEAAGHKIISVVSSDGKLTPALLDVGLARHEDEHSVLPRVVFVSQATETGTVYTAQELTALTAHAHAAGLYVYMDGARLATALAASDPVESLAGVAQAGIDMLYIGGTKNGGLFGEAVVILNDNLREDFRYHMKQRGALLAKGRVLGAQFARFFAPDKLWYQLGADANARATRLAVGLTSLGVELAQACQANQVFPLLPMTLIDELAKDFGFHVWTRLDNDRAVIRLVCSWATPEARVDDFIARVKALSAV